MRKGVVHFLGTDIHVVTTKTKGLKTRLTLKAPLVKIIQRLVKKKFLKWNSTHRLRGTGVSRIVNWDHRKIVKYYSAVIGGLMNYYSFANNWPQ